MIVLILHKKIQFYIFMFEAWNVAKGHKVQGGRILSQGTVNVVHTSGCGYVNVVHTSGCGYVNLVHTSGCGYVNVVHTTNNEDKKRNRRGQNNNKSYYLFALPCSTIIYIVSQIWCPLGPMDLT